jgi:DNA phosphorothioation-associated putative methyltransferase
MMKALAVAAVDESAESANVVGKRLPTHLYIHKQYVHTLDDDIKILVAKALLVAGEYDYDLVKIAHDGSYVCLLSYPDFDTNAHPALKYSIKVFLSNGAFCVTDYSKSANPPILHRKEAFVSPTHPHYADFARLTEAEAAHRLLNRHDIGNRKQWKALLASKNLTIKGHSLSKNK